MTSNPEPPSPPLPDLASLADANEAAKKLFGAGRYAAAVKAYDAGLETMDREAIAALAARAAWFLDTGDASRAAALSSFVLRLKPNYFEAASTYATAASKIGAADAAEILLRNYLEKDGTDEEAAMLLKKIVDARKGGDDPSVVPFPDLVVDVVADFPDDFKLVGNVLNNVALCCVKTRRFDAAANSAAQALLFLKDEDSRTKAAFRLALSLVHLSTSNSTSSSSAASVLAAFESRMKKPEVRRLRSALSEASGRHDWAAALRAALKDPATEWECVEWLSPKLGLGDVDGTGLGLVANADISRGDILCVQRSVHYIPATSSSSSSASAVDAHVDFPKRVLARVLDDPLEERALRLLGRKGKLVEEGKTPKIGQAFRRLPYFLPFLYDQLPVTQIRAEAKTGVTDTPIKTFEGSPDGEEQGRRLASILTETLKSLQRQTTSLATTFDDRYKKTMTQTGDGDSTSLGQLGLWPVPALLRHSDRPNVTWGTIGGVAVVTAVRDVASGLPLVTAMAGIQCLPDRRRHLQQMSLQSLDGPLEPTQEKLVAEAQSAFVRANGFKMDTVGLDQGEAMPLFDKAIEECLTVVETNAASLTACDPLGLAAIYFTLADCLGGKKDLAAMVKAYFMGVKSAHEAVVVSLDTLTRMTKMKKFLPMAKKIEDMQTQAEMVAKNNPSLKEELKKITRLKDIGPSVASIEADLDEQIPAGCRLVFGTKEAASILS